jgi:hypothetical protein
MMENNKLKLKRLHKSKPLSEITNTGSKKLKKIRSKKLIKSSDFKQGIPQKNSENLIKNKAFYVNLKENQLLNLSNALKLNIENLKCRYKLIKIKLKKQADKKALLHSKIAAVSPMPGTCSRINIDLSPISICESQSTTLSLLNSRPTENERKISFNRKLNFDQFEKQIKTIQDENSELIEKEFTLKEKNNY